MFVAFVQRGVDVRSQQCRHVTDDVNLVQVAPQFWEAWKEFEINHGNEDTVREMLRIKRSVQATYNTQVFSECHYIYPDVGKRHMSTADQIQYELPRSLATWPP